ncbi:MAG: hypothetical protein ACI9U2_003371 [Bradymonadia bacterium]
MTVTRSGDNEQPVKYRFMSARRTLQGVQMRWILLAILGLSGAAMAQEQPLDAQDMAEMAEADGLGAAALAAAAKLKAAGGNMSTCAKGKCAQVCAPGNTCTLKCPGGKCAQACGPTATCTLECGGGKCKQAADALSKGSLSCAGGKCIQAAPATMTRTCSGGGCK